MWQCGGMAVWWCGAGSPRAVSPVTMQSNDMVFYVYYCRAERKEREGWFSVLLRKLLV